MLDSYIMVYTCIYIDTIVDAIITLLHMLLLLFMRRRHFATWNSCRYVRMCIVQIRVHHYTRRRHFAIWNTCTYMRMFIVDMCTDVHVCSCYTILLSISAHELREICTSWAFTSTDNLPQELTFHWWNLWAL